MPERKNRVAIRSLADTDPGGRRQILEQLAQEETPRHLDSGDRYFSWSAPARRRAIRFPVYGLATRTFGDSAYS
jgi:hypothetical protein